MQRLYAPWRGTYHQHAQEKTHLKKGCPFCAAINSSCDEEHYVIKRFSSTTALLNLYPYNPGHLLIIPNQHAAHLADLELTTRHELMDNIAFCVELLEKKLGNSGTNVGINLGDSASGGSIPEHLHIHVVPRWQGDTNFMPVINDTKQLSADLNEIYALLK